MSHVQRDLILHVDEASARQSHLAIDTGDTASLRSR